MRFWAFCLFGIFISCKGQEVQAELFAEGFDAPVEAAHMGDSRLFIVEQSGKIRILNADGSINSEAFLDVSSLISTGGERGLLGMAFSPDYETDGRFFINYTDISGNTVVARYNVSENPDIANPEQTIILTFNQPYSNHNGGMMKFGDDGYLWIATGDGGSGGDPQNNSQNTDVLLGKMLRIDVSGESYSIPPDNPFANGGGAPEIWYYGLRNPWKFAFDAQSGEVWIADVGQNQIEEINRVSVSEGGLNFGWRCYEGDQPYNTSGCEDPETMIFPVATYNHQSGRCSITGGYIYKGIKYPGLYGKYFFGDYCSGEVGWVDEEGLEFLFKISGVYITSFAEDSSGELYVLGSGKVFKLKGEALGIIDQQEEALRLYPNPSEHLVHIQSTSPLSQVLLYSSEGRLLREYKEDLYTVSLSGLPAGVYWLRILGDRVEKHSKIIKK